MEGIANKTNSSLIAEWHDCFIFLLYKFWKPSQKFGKFCLKVADRVCCQKAQHPGITDTSDLIMLSKC